MAISEKKAPNQSIVRNPKSIPTTRPLLFRSSNGTGAYPAISSTAASTPTSVTGHETPRRYGPRITNTRSTSIPAKMSASAIASNVVVQTRHFLYQYNGISKAIKVEFHELLNFFACTPPRIEVTTSRPQNSINADAEKEFELRYSPLIS